MGNQIDSNQDAYTGNPNLVWICLDGEQAVGEKFLQDPEFRKDHGGGWRVGPAGGLLGGLRQSQLDEMEAPLSPGPWHTDSVGRLAGKAGIRIRKDEGR